MAYKKKTDWTKWLYWAGGAIAAAGAITLIKIKDGKTVWDMILEKIDK